LRATAITLAFLTTAALAGCGGTGHSPATPEAESTVVTGATSSPTAPTSGSAGSTGAGSASRPTQTAAGTARASAASPLDEIAAENCLNAQIAYQPVVDALTGSSGALRDAAGQSAPPPLDTNTTTAAGRAATQAILDLQDSVLRLATDGSATASGFSRQLAAARKACGAAGAPIFSS
jgi:hypothetical protein